MHKPGKIQSQVLRQSVERESTVIQQAAETIRREGVVAYLSDTVYGLGCDPWSERALQRLFHAKGRAPEKGVLLLISDVEMAEQLVAHPPETWDRLAEELWPGPFTLLLPASQQLPLLVRGSANKVGVRIPDSAFLRKWIEAIPGPIVSTSANPSGRETPRSFDEVLRYFAGKVDLLIDGGDPADGLSSTVIDLCSTPPEIVRPGQGADRAAKLVASLTGEIHARFREGKSRND